MNVRAVFTGINEDMEIHEIDLTEGAVFELLSSDYAAFVILGLPDGRGLIQYSKSA